jgi:predicted ATP-grasp superfamily ATP-dependent carboligase
MSYIELPLHRLDRTRMPVVLVGGLNITRALGLAGIPVVVASADPEEPAFSSRYCVGRCQLPSLKSGGAAVEVLVQIGDRLANFFGSRALLLTGSDDGLALIGAHRERLSRYFRFLLSEPEVGEALIAKDRFQALAMRRGLPVPRALDWVGDGPGSLRAAAGPVLVKPKVKFDWHHSVLCRRLFDNGDGKALIFESGAAALAEPAVAMHRDQLTVQEYVAGGDGDHWSYHGLADEAGEVLVELVGRKIRTYPTLTGESAYIELALEPSLARLGREVARKLPLAGVFKMDFKRDPATGRWYLLEINARCSLWHYLGAAHGVNLPAAAYEYLVLGRRPRQPDYRPRKRWLALALDFRAYREMAARGELTLAGWLASLAGRKVYNFFSWSDPAPWARHMLRRVKRVAMRVPARFGLAAR